MAQKRLKKKPTETYFCVDTKYWKFKGGDPDPYGPQRGSTTAEYTDPFCKKTYQISTISWTPRGAMSVIEKVPFLHEIVIADAQELVQVISPGVNIRAIRVIPRFCLHQ